jgi:hypothetical protein
MCSLGKSIFSRARPGIYNTMMFPVPDRVSDALRSATFNDLTFEFMLNSPGSDEDRDDGPVQSGRYVFDNLRVH